MNVDIVIPVDEQFYFTERTPARMGNVLQWENGVVPVVFSDWKEAVLWADENLDIRLNLWVVEFTPNGKNILMATKEDPLSVYHLWSQTNDVSVTIN